MRSFLLIVIALLILPACGNVEQIHHKNYQLFINSDDNAFRQKVEDLVSRYNEKAGQKVLNLTPNSHEANSTIELVDGLETKEGKIGYGSWQTHSDDKHNWIGTHTKINIHYSMNVQFDREWFEKRMSAALNSEEDVELFTLFCHETGHGLQMDHANDPNDVMYYMVYYHENIQFEEYFASVRSFFE